MKPLDYSQNGEYEKLSSIINKDFLRYVVDVGVYDGITFSNSYPLIKKGWKSLLIEANPFIFNKLKQNIKKYPNAIPINVACSNQNGEGHLYFGRDGIESMLSTLCQDNNSWFDFARTDTKVKVPIRTLENLLDKNNFPRDFGILMVDTEGMDLEVLEGLNFDKYQPSMIITEEYLHNLSKHKAKYRFLKDNGYLFKQQINCNTVWVHKSKTNDESISKDALNIKKILFRHLIQKASSYVKFEEIRALFDSQKYSIDLIKKPKWNDDALLFKIEPLNRGLFYQWTIKIHEDKYPLASHIYDNEALLNRIVCSGQTTKILNTSVVKNQDLQFRIVTYDYVSGKPLDKLLPLASNAKILNLRQGLKNCVSTLLQLGVNVFVRDLNDFLVVSKKDKQKIILTDFNAILDCSNANEYSKTKIMKIVGNIIDKLIKPTYKPFISERPTMIDLENSLDLRF